MSAEKFIANTLRIAHDDLAAARLLAQAGNRNASYLCEQAAEKIIRAVLTSEGIRAERSEQHRLSLLVDKVPDENPVKPGLRAVQDLERFATTFRYATDAGRIPDALDETELEQLTAGVESVLAEVARRFGVDLAKPDQPAASAGKIR